VGYSINRFLDYLGESGLMDPVARQQIYQPLLDAYLEWMGHYQHASDGTLKVRSHSIAQFFEWLGTEATPEGLLKLTGDRIEDFFLGYAQRMGRSARHSMQSALRSFLRFCLHKGYIERSLECAVPTLRTYKLATVPRGLSDPEAQQVLGSINPNSHVGRRDYAIVQLLYTYGVRGGQVRALGLEDIDWAQNQILFKASKQGKDSRLPLTAEVGESLLDYLQNSIPCLIPAPFRLSWSVVSGLRASSFPARAHMPFGIALPPECSTRVIRSRPLPTCSVIAILAAHSSIPKWTSTP
jgi:site-specific recombinase XerD